MKIAIPNDGQNVNQHFGRSSSFIVATLENDKIKTIEDVSTAEMAHQHQALVDMMKSKEVEVVIVGGIGQGALSALEDSGLKVIKGAVGEYRKVLDEYINGTLKSKDVTCGHHHHGEHHHQHH